MKIILSENRFLLFLLCSAYFYTFVSVSDLPWSVFLLSIASSAGLLTLYLMLNLDIILMKRYRIVNLLALIYSMSVLISVYFNGMLSLYTLLIIILGLSVLPFVEVQKEKGHLLFLCKTMMFWLCIFLLLNDILMIIMPGRFFGDGVDKTFLLGNKFATGYDHMLLLLMVCILYGKHPLIRKYLPFMFAVVCMICLYIDCNTAALGTAVFFLISYAPRQIQNLLSRKSVVFTAMVLCALFVFISNLLLIPSVKYFITEVLERDLTLTGRAQIYEILPKVIRARPLFGYGTSSEVIYRYTAAYNAQNGFFDLAVANGVPSACFFVFLITALIKKTETKEAGFILGLIFAFLIMSTVEVTYGTTLMLFGILLFTDSSEYREDSIKIIEWGG